MFFQIAFVFVLGNQDSSTSSLQSDLESDEDDGAVFTAKNGTKWKKHKSVSSLQADLQVIIF